MSKSETSSLFKTKYTKLLEFFLANPEPYYVNQLLEKVKLSPQVLCEGLKELETMQILTSEKRANAIYYQVKKDHPLLPGLKKMIKPMTYKEAGVDIDAANEAVKKMKSYRIVFSSSIKLY